MTTIAIVDLETNGLAPPAEALELARCDLVKSEGAEWVVGLPTAQLFGCRAPLDPAARAAHHLRPVDLETKPFFVATPDCVSGADAVACHNLTFEQQWLGEAFADKPLICTYKAALRVWPDAPSHSNGALRYWLEDQGLITPAWSVTQPAHRAGPDAYVTAWILKALLETGVSGREMVQWAKEPRLLPTCPIGEKWRGKKWADVDGGFLDWMTKQQTMEPDLKWLARRELDRRSLPA
jgi:exodeoxyribonuclease X